MANGNEYPVLPSTAVYPSYSTARNRMEIRMAENAMAIGDFEKIFTESNTSEIHIIDTESKSDVAYFNYSVVASIGKQRTSTIAVESSQQVNTVELVVVLEQLTYLEVQLKNLGLTI